EHRGARQPPGQGDDDGGQDRGPGGVPFGVAAFGASGATPAHQESLRGGIRAEDLDVGAFRGRGCVTGRSHLRSLRPGPGGPGPDPGVRPGGTGDDGTTRLMVAPQLHRCATYPPRSYGESATSVLVGGGRWGDLWATSSVGPAVVVGGGRWGDLWATSSVVAAGVRRRRA